MRNHLSLGLNTKIKNLMDILGLEEEERVLCPLRAIRYYIHRTGKIRGPASSLWCAVRNPSSPMSKNAISFFLRDLIREAHAQIEENRLPILKVKAHDIRAVATSLAFRHNLSLESILNCTFWRSKSLFATHYLKEVETIYENCSTLGGLLVAGTVLGGDV